MTPIHPLEDLFNHAEYRVRLPRGGYATIRVGAPLPAPLLEALPAPGCDWGYITAWNPRGKSRDRQVNRMAQRELRNRLRHEFPEARIEAGVGTLGAWREPCLFVVGIDTASLDALMLRFDQLAVLSGHGDGPAMLRWSPIHASVDGPAP